MILSVLPFIFSLQAQTRTVAIGTDLAADAGIRVGDTVVVSGRPETAGEADGAGGGIAAGPLADTVIVSAIVERRADPSEISRSDYRVRLHLDQLDICVSTGSACHSTTHESSATLRAMNVPYTAAQGSIRFSLGRYNTDADIETTLRVLPEIIEKLAAMSPYAEASSAARNDL